MGNSQEDLGNENLFRAKVCLPVAIFFSIIAVNAVMGTTNIVMTILFVLIAIGFSLTTLAYAAFFTNEFFGEEH